MTLSGIIHKVASNKRPGVSMAVVAIVIDNHNASMRINAATRVSGLHMNRR